MSLRQDFLFTKSFRSVAVIVTAVSLFCTQVPLFNYLGFEFSALTAILGGFLSGLLLIMRWNKVGERLPSMDRFFGESLLAAILALTIPLVVMSANAFVVKNCAFSQGLVLFLLMPLPATVFANSVALLISVALARWRKTVFTIVYLAMLSHILVVTFTTPQIFAFNPIAGFFPGITYDESLDPEGRLLVYRVGVLAAACVFFIAARIILRKREGSTAGEGRPPVRPGELIGGAVLVVLVSWLFFFSHELGLSSSRKFIQEKLGGRYETAHFVIVYPSGKLNDEQVRRVALLHEFYFTHISRELRILPARKIQSFLYASPEQKGRLVGAAGTDIAKPWLWQLHINLENIERSLKHELVHVMAAEFGFPLLRISLNSGLIEGLAVAVERVEYDETLHRLAAQIMALGRPPDVRSLFSVSGFFKIHGGTSYTLAGSFCRYLIDQYGIRRFKSLYRTGNFQTLYNKDLETLINEWQRFISEPETSRDELHKAAYLFKRPSIFGKECARVIADLNAETRELLRRRKYEEASGLSKRSLDLTKSSEAVFLHAASLLRLKKYDEAARFSREELTDSAIAHTLLPLYLTLGDALWSMGRVAEARHEYQRLYGFHLGLGLDEASALRTAALSDPRRAMGLAMYFVSDMTDSARIQFLKSAFDSNPTDPVVLYLLGRELLSVRKISEGLDLLQKVKHMNAPILEFLRHRRAGWAYVELGEYQKAKAFFWESLNFTTKESHRIEVSEWIERCDWMELNAEKY